MVLFDIILFLLVLSLLVAVHEFGHFIAAKACNIYVDRFSIGMPPRIAGFKWGETDYCIGALPIGGYVKMAGQEDAPLSEEEREADYGHVPSDRWFNSKPVWQRAIVLIAGPAMNLVLAVIIYMILAAAGGEVPEYELEAKIGQVTPDSPAALAPMYLQSEGITGEPDLVGWKTGDVIVSVNDQPVENIPRLAVMGILNGTEDEQVVLVKRPEADGSFTSYLSSVTPKLLSEEEEHPRLGVGPFLSAHISALVPGKPAERVGLQAGDVITKVNGEIVDQAGLVERTSTAAEGQALALLVKRGDEMLDISVTPEPVGRIDGLVLDGEAATENADAPPVVIGITEEQKEALPLKEGDVIAKVNGAAVNAQQFRELEQTSPGQSLELTVERPAKFFGLKQRAETLTVSVPVEEVRWLGVTTSALDVFHRVPTSQIFSEGLHRSWESVILTLNTLKALVQRTVGMKDLGGPLMIFDVTTKAAEEGWLYLARVTAFISINLAIFNLLPLPVLDGGQLVVNLIEAIRRKPLSPVFLERFQQLGLVMIIALMVFVTFNDVVRMWGD